MNTDFCTEAVEDALAKYGKPEISNTDQGSQLTSAEFTGLLTQECFAIKHGPQGRVAR
jgi:putative transposase